MANFHFLHGLAEGSTAFNRGPQLHPRLPIFFFPIIFKDIHYRCIGLSQYDESIQSVGVQCVRSTEVLVMVVLKPTSTPDAQDCFSKA
jgi:hypothetical protein